MHDPQDGGNGLPSVTWPPAPEAVPPLRCRFELTPPRHFLYPAILLLLAEQPRHGYRLVDALGGFGLGAVDRAGVYRALTDLEGDGLVRTWNEPPTAGSTRHVYALTTFGRQMLEAWMSTIAREQASLELMLHRYWYTNAQLLSIDLAETGDDEVGVRPPTKSDGPRPETERVHFVVATDRSSLVVEARSNIGPIAFSTRSLSGELNVRVRDGFVVADPAPEAMISACIADLTSGNPVYDNELLRRADARRYPIVTLGLASASQVGEGNRYQVAGTMTLHGVTRTLDGSVTATVLEHSGRVAASSRRRPGIDRSLTISGDQVIDVRHFGMEVPTMPLLRLYPDVRLHLHLEADTA